MTYRPTYRSKFISAGVVLLGLAAASCAGPSTPVTTRGSTTTTQLVTTTTSENTTTTSLATTTTSPTAGLVLPVALEGMPDTWPETFFIPYGETEDTLGTSPGGEGGTVQWGPEYGAQHPDGTWWFLDTARLRLAHFSESGQYLGQVPVPESLLVNGVYFQYQIPRILDDGTLLASRSAGSSTEFLRLRDDVIDRMSVPAELVPRVDDGALLYGFGFGEDSIPMVVDPSRGTSEPTEWFYTRAGNRFWVETGTSELFIRLPDANPAVELQLPIEAGELGGKVYFSVEVATGEDGTIHLFLIGLGERDESLQLAGYLTVDPDGAVSALEAMRDPFSPSDPGSPSRLGIRPTTSQPWIMFIDTDGVRVFHRVEAEERRRG